MKTSNQMPSCMANIIREDLKIDSFRRFDFSKFTMPMIVIYEKPLDYSNSYVARVYNYDPILKRYVPTKYVAVKESYESLIKEIPLNLAKVERCVEDDPCIVEIYM